MKPVRLMSISCAAFALIACETAPQGAGGGLPSGVAFIETVSPVAGEIGVPYEKFVLDNGLTVILHEDKSDPLVHVDVTYHVGSAREEIGKSGFAHFFEHMMFQGSENVADEEHFRIVTQAGGIPNGTTSFDRTNYFQTVPGNHLERVLWLEADRMGFLLPAVTQRKFEVQRATVKNERAQRYENKPYGLLGERVFEALYPETHPYSWQPIGYVEDLDRVDVDDLKSFFLRWYGPNNATLTIGGDFDRDQTLDWVEKYFGSIPRGPEVAKPRKPSFALDADRYLSMEDNVALPLIQKAWPTAYARHQDEAPLDALMSILGAGKTALLYQSLVKTGHAVQAQATHFCAELSCVFAVTVVPNPASGASLTDIDRIIAETFERFETRGVTHDDLQRVKAGIVAGMVYNLESVAGKVSQLAYFETFFDNPGLIAADIERYEAVTKTDVLRVYETYIKNKPSVTMSIVPKGQADAVAKPDNWAKPERALRDDEETLKPAVRMLEDDFDRSETPQAEPRPAVTPPAIWRDETPNGIEILGAVNTEVPTTTMRFFIHAGQREEKLDQLGLASLTAALLNEATMGSTAEDVSDALQKLGSQVSIAASDDYTILSVRSLTANLDATLAIAAEKLFSPKFDEMDFARLQARMIQGIRQARKDPGVLADNARRTILYGTDNAFAHANSGTEETVAALTIDDVRAFYSDVLRTAKADMVVVSDLSKINLLTAFAAFALWEGDGAERASIMPFPVLKAGALYFLDKPGAAQSEIRIARRAMAYDATGAFFRAGLANFALGGNFNSRINQNLREDKGYTYGASSRFGASNYAGAFVASAAVRADATGGAIQELIAELNTYAENGMTDAELRFMKDALAQRAALAYETPAAKAGYLSNILLYDLPTDYVRQQHDIVEGVSIDELNAVAGRVLDPADMVFIVVGDGETIRPQLNTLGLEIIDVAPHSSSP